MASLFLLLICSLNCTFVHSKRHFKIEGIMIHYKWEHNFYVSKFYTNRNKIHWALTYAPMKKKPATKSPRKHKFLTSWGIYSVINCWWWWWWWYDVALGNKTIDFAVLKCVCGSNKYDWFIDIYWRAVHYL